MTVQQAVSPEQQTVVVVDHLVLRRAAWLSLLRPWAASNGVGLVSVSADDMSTEMARDGDCALGLLSLGALSLRAHPATDWMRRMQEGLGGAPIAVVADSEAVDEIVAAFRGGARGYVTTATPPEIALEAFAFIMRGGSFFPPGPLLEKATTGCRTQPAEERGGADGSSSGEVHSLLTSRQSDVLLHLRTGKSNKAIARLLGMQEATVKVHVRQVMRKLGAVNRTQAALSAFRAALDGCSPANDDHPATAKLAPALRGRLSSSPPSASRSGPAGRRGSRAA